MTKGLNSTKDVDSQIQINLIRFNSELEWFVSFWVFDSKKKSLYLKNLRAKVFEF